MNSKSVDSKSPTKSKPSTKPRSKSARKPATENIPGWVRNLSRVALVVFVAIPLIGFLIPSLAGRIVWTIAVASLPLFIVLVGYHRWRNICPLAFFAKLPNRLGFAGEKRFPREYEGHYYYICFGVFVFSLWMRLIATNGSGFAIAIFFISIASVAFTTGAIFTGKTWCNYFCPVLFVEKIYTEPHGLRETDNSQCGKCTACKKACPDINEENGYWKEVMLTSKRLVYFSFPGVVYGFYFYYFLQSHQWAYYFDGPWVNEPLPFFQLFLPGTAGTVTQGFYFWPAFPRAAAALLTLITCGSISFVFFSLIERILTTWKRKALEADETIIRHWMLTITAFTAFVTFYSFAGAPSIAKLPTGARQLFQIVFVLTASLFLVRRLFRNQVRFAEETLARNILKRWKWKDIDAPTDLREAFLINQIRTLEQKKQTSNVLELYKESVAEVVRNGLVSASELSLLQSLRDKLQISQSQHDEVMQELSEQERGTFNAQLNSSSAEKQLQMDSYQAALSEYFGQVFDRSTPADDQAINQLRKDYRVSEEEHQWALEQIKDNDEGFSDRLNKQIRMIELMSLTQQHLARGPTASRNFLCMTLKRARERGIERLLNGLNYSPTDQPVIEKWREALNEDSAESAGEIGQQTGLANTIDKRLAAAYRDMVAIRQSFPDFEMILWEMVNCSDSYVRAAAVYELFQSNDLTEEGLRQLAEDNEPIVSETIAGLIKRESDNESELLELEKLIALFSVPTFSTLGLFDLIQLSEASEEQRLSEGEVLCQQGETGSEVFIIQSGDIAVSRIDAGKEVKIAESEGNDIFGEMAVLDPAPRSATLKAGPAGAIVLKLDGKAFEDIVNKNPKIVFPVMKSLVQRLRTTIPN